MKDALLAVKCVRLHAMKANDSRLSCALKRCNNVGGSLLKTGEPKAKRGRATACTQSCAAGRATACTQSCAASSAACERTVTVIVSACAKRVSTKHEGGGACCIEHSHSDGLGGVH